MSEFTTKPNEDEQKLIPVELVDATETLPEESNSQRYVRLGRISAFGPSLDGGFGIND